MEHFAFAMRFASRGRERRDAWRANLLVPRQAVRTMRPIAHFITACSTLIPGAASTITGGPFGTAITVEVGSATGSEHDNAMSPSLTALAPRNATFSAPSGNVASPTGGFTCATP